jgi:hypothetical protein
MEAPRGGHAPQQDRGTRSSARILDAHNTLADARVACQRSICLFYYFFPRSHSRGWSRIILFLTADPTELEDCIRCLGLQSIRAKRLISLSAAYLGQLASDRDQQEQPGSQSLRRSTSISHLPGSGPYALDSYRIYCGGPDAWRTVVPRDKELIRFIVRPFFAQGSDIISDQ